MWSQWQRLIRVSILLFQVAPFPVGTIALTTTGCSDGTHPATIDSQDVAAVCQHCKNVHTLFADAVELAPNAGVALGVNSWACSYGKAVSTIMVAGNGTPTVMHTTSCLASEIIYQLGSDGNGGLGMLSELTNQRQETETWLTARSAGGELQWRVQLLADVIAPVRIRYFDGRYVVFGNFGNIANGPGSGGTTAVTVSAAGVIKKLAGVGDSDYDAKDFEISPDGKRAYLLAVSMGWGKYMIEVLGAQSHVKVVLDYLEVVSDSQNVQIVPATDAAFFLSAYRYDAFRAPWTSTFIVPLSLDGKPTSARREFIDVIATASHPSGGIVIFEQPMDESDIQRHVDVTMTWLAPDGIRGKTSLDFGGSRLGPVIPVADGWLGVAWRDGKSEDILEMRRLIPSNVGGGIVEALALPGVRQGTCVALACGPGMRIFQ